jgi:hypothetical protein
MKNPERRKEMTRKLRIIFLTGSGDTSIEVQLPITAEQAGHIAESLRGRLLVTVDGRIRTLSELDELSAEIEEIFALRPVVGG